MTLSPEAQFITGPQVPIGDSWFDTTLIAKAKMHGETCPTAPPADENSNAFNEFVLLHYYDLPLSEYVAYKRTGDPFFQTQGRKCADSWYKHPDIGEGNVKRFPDSVAPSPRHSGILGMLCRAFDGRPEMLPWITAYTLFSFDHWCKKRVTSPSLFYGLREGAFSLHAAVALAKVHPDSAVRAQLIADIETVCINYFGRLQHPDGSWRWGTAPDEFVDTDGGTLQGIMQPFMVGLLLCALCDAHEVVASEAAKASIKTQILTGCRHLYEGGAYRKDEPVPADPSKSWRAFWYFYHGGTTVNPTRYAKGGGSEDGTQLWHVASERQSIGIIVGPFGKAFQLSGDPFFKAAGDELWNAAYSGSDGIRSLMDSSAKNFNQHARFAGRYPAYVGAIAQPAPAPQPTPTPTPAPTKPPSPDGTKCPPAPEIVDSLGATWTFGPEKQTLRDRLQVGNGAGSIYKFVSAVVHVLGMDNNWYKWTGSAWVKVGAEPGVVVPPVIIPPQPPPTTQTTRVVPYPKQPSKRNQILDAQWKEGYRLKSEADASAVFEKVL